MSGQRCEEAVGGLSEMRDAHASLLLRSACVAAGPLLLHTLSSPTWCPLRIQIYPRIRVSASHPPYPISVYPCPQLLRDEEALVASGSGHPDVLNLFGELIAVR